MGSCALVAIDASCRKSVKKRVNKNLDSSNTGSQFEAFIGADLYQVGEVGCREMVDNFAN